METQCKYLKTNLTDLDHDVATAVMKAMWPPPVLKLRKTGHTGKTLQCHPIILTFPVAIDTTIAETPMDGASGMSNVKCFGISKSWLRPQPTSQSLSEKLLPQRSVASAVKLVTLVATVTR